MALGKLGTPKQTIQFMQSYHQGMQAKIHLAGNFLEEMDVDNGTCASEPFHVPDDGMLAW